jgi:hypothetical protein
LENVIAVDHFYWENNLDQSQHIKDIVVSVDLGVMKDMRMKKLIQDFI